MRARARVVVVDDAPEVRLVVRTSLRLSGHFDVVAEAGDGAAAIDLARKHQPELMLLDVSMPGVDGLQALPLVLEVSPDTQVVVYTGFAEEGLAVRARQLGAAAYLEKSAKTEEVVETLLSLLPEQKRTNLGPVDGALHDQDGTGEEVLSEHLERFREVFEEAAIGMATMTLSGQLVRSNRAFADLVGRPVDQLVGTPYAAIAGETTGATLAALHAGEQLVGQFEHDLPGTGRRALSAIAPIRDSRGRPLYLFVQLQDVTAQRQAQEQLRQSEERFRLLVEAVEGYAIFMLDPEGRIASWNAGAERINGYTADEIIGQHFRVFYPPEKQAEQHPEHELEWALRDGRYEEEGWRVRKDGTRFWASVLITAVFDEHGRHVGFTKVTRDITAQRGAQEQLRQSEERFRLLVEVVEGYAIFMLDPEGRIASWNAGAERIKGYTADEIIGQHFRVFYPPHKQAEQHPEHELEWALRDGRYEEEGWRVRKDGTRFWANVLITAVFDGQGRHLGFTKVTRDMTERRQMLQNLEEANQRLKESAQQQADFLSVTAHELRTPIGVVSASVDMLHQHWDAMTDEERDDLLGSVSSSAGRLRRLLTDLLVTSRIEAGTIEYRRELFGVEPVVRRAVEAVRALHPDVPCEVDIEPGLTAYGDPDRVAQAVENLVANAATHGAPPIRVTVRTVPGSVPGTGSDAGLDAGSGTSRVTTIRVTDAGEGVPEAIRGRLFQRFATGKPRSGTGLGLFIVREVARAMGGEADYEPAAPGRPGAFVLTLPAAAMV